LMIQGIQMGIMRTVLGAALISLSTGGVIAQDDHDFGIDFGIDFVTVDDPGNSAYPGEFGILAGRGSVDYTFRVSRTEITSGQWMLFVNQFGTMSDELGDLLRTDIWPAYTDPSYNGPGQRYVYSSGVIHPELSPVGISWRQAAMFCNWMHNGRSDDPQTLFYGVYDTSTFTRNDDENTFNDQDTHFPGARYWIVTLDEYLKAVYYDPDKNGHGPGWWEFGHSSDEPPVYGMPGVGDVGRELGEEELIQLAGLPSPSFIPLGIYTNAQSPWGLLDVLGGNTDFVEDWGPDVYRRARARKYAGNTSFFYDYRGDRVWDLQLIDPRADGGFRIASLPRPAADLNHDWNVNFFDVSRFIELYMASDSTADFDGDGELDTDDVYRFLELYQDANM